MFNSDHVQVYIRASVLLFTLIFIYILLTYFIIIILDNVLVFFVCQLLEALD